MGPTSVPPEPVAGAFFHPPIPAVAATRQSPTDAYPRHSVPRAVHRAAAPPRTHPGALARPLETTDAMRGSIAIRLSSPKPGALRPCAAASVGRRDSTREFRRRDGRRVSARSPTLPRCERPEADCFAVCEKNCRLQNPRGLIVWAPINPQGLIIARRATEVGARESRSRFSVLRVARATK